MADGTLPLTKCGALAARVPKTALVLELAEQPEDSTGAPSAHQPAQRRSATEGLEHGRGALRTDAYALASGGSVSPSRDAATPVYP
jgi:hypothetical protein